MIKLNKNQKKFFEEAMNYFGDKSNDVRLKDINAFATEFDLIVPTSALKHHCQEDGQIRGHYNLFLSGIKPLQKEPKPMKEFKSSSNVIIDTPAFVDDAPKKQRKRFNPSGMQRMRFINPIYVVTNSNGTIISIRKRITDAFEDRIFSLHDQGNKLIDEVKEELDYIGSSRINSNNSQLWCDIVIYELK